MPGYDPNEARDPIGRWTKSLGSAMQTAASDKDLKKFTVGYSPFREGNISDLGDASKAFENEMYQAWKSQGTQIANLMGVHIVNSADTIGIYEATTDNAETSRVIEVKGKPEDVRGYAAIMGSIAPDRQHSVMVNRYDRNGDASENYINFKSKASAINFVENRKQFGINDLSYAPDKNQVLILDFGNFEKEKFFKNYGQQIASVRQRKVQTEFIGEDQYAGIVQEVRSRLQGRDFGSRGKLFDSILNSAEKRSTEKIE